MESFSLHLFDGSIVVIYLIVVVMLGFYTGSKHLGAEDDFLAGRNPPCWVIIVGSAIKVFSIAVLRAFRKPRFLYMTTVHLVACILVSFIVLLLSRAKTEADLKQIVWSPRAYRLEFALEAYPWYKRYLVHALF